MRKVPNFSLRQMSIALFSLLYQKVSGAGDDELEKDSTLAIVLSGVLLAIGTGTQIALVKNFNKIEKQSTNQVFLKNTKANYLLSVLSGLGLGAGAWITPWFNFTQSSLLGMGLSALNMFYSEVKLILKARDDLPSEDQKNTDTRDDSTSTLTENYLETLNQLIPTYDAEDQKNTELAKSIKNNSVIKLFFLVVTAVGLEAVLNYTGMGKAEEYITAEQTALLSPILANGLWNMVSRVKIPAISSPVIEEGKEIVINYSQLGNIT